MTCSRDLTSDWGSLCRSPAVAVAFLMKLRGWRLMESFKWVKDRRPATNLTQGAFPSAQQFLQLVVCMTHMATIPWSRSNLRCPARFIGSLAVTFGSNRVYLHKCKIANDQMPLFPLQQTPVNIVGHRLQADPGVAIPCLATSGCLSTFVTKAYAVFCLMQCVCMCMNAADAERLQVAEVQLRGTSSVGYQQPNGTIGDPMCLLSLSSFC